MTTTKTRSSPWDAADYLATDEDVAAYIEAAFEDGDARLVAAALGDVARAKGTWGWRSWVRFPPNSKWLTHKAATTKPSK